MGAPCGSRRLSSKWEVARVRAALRGRAQHTAGVSVLFFSGGKDSVAVGVLIVRRRGEILS